MEFSDCAEKSNDLSLLIDPLYFFGVGKGGGSIWQSRWPILKASLCLLRKPL